MDILQALILALIQGLTEFLPISSSAHLILPKELLAWPDQGLAFDVAVHIGSLAAVMLYFRKDIVEIVIAWLHSLQPGKQSQQSRLGWYIIVATIPAGLAGLVLGDFIEKYLRSMEVIAATTILFGLLLWWADKSSDHRKQLADMSLKLAIVIGVAQALALVPGTSRSGITITAALLLGFGRSDAARFSFLLAIPVILLSGAYMATKLMGEAIDWPFMITGILASGVSAWLCIHFFLEFINRIGMLPFVIYRLLLGAVLILVILQ